MFLNPDTQVVPNTERGSALLAVLGVMAVTVVIGLTITVATVNGLQVTSNTKASVQSRAAAASGVDVASLAIRQGTCQLGLPYPVPNVSVTTQYLKANGKWEDCPLNLATAANPTGFKAPSYKVVSTGTASATGVAGNSGGNSPTRVEAIFGYPPLLPTGVGMYIYGGITVKNNASLRSYEPGGVPLSVQVKKGSITCGNGSTIVGTVSIEGGSISDCGTPTIIRSAVPGWVDIGYEPAKWINTDGTPYRVTTTTAAKCDLSDLVALTAPGPAPAIVDARACAPGVTGQGDVTLKSDTVIFGKSFDFRDNGGKTFITASPGNFKLWFITPDEVRDGVPTLSAPCDFSMKNNFIIDPSVDAMLYTPCTVSAKNNWSWHGQIYAGAIDEINNNFVLGFKPVGMAGFDGNTGTRVDFGLISMRDLAR